MTAKTLYERLGGYDAIADAAENSDELVSPAEAIRVAMARK